MLGLLPTDNFGIIPVTPTNYISSEREFNEEYDSLKKIKSILITLFYLFLTLFFAIFAKFRLFLIGLKRILNSKNVNKSYIILEHKTWRFRI